MTALTDPKQGQGQGREFAVRALRAEQPALVELAATRVARAGGSIAESGPSVLRDRLSTSLTAVLESLHQYAPEFEVVDGILDVTALCEADGAPPGAVMKSVDTVASLLVDFLETTTRVLPEGERDAVLATTLNDLASIASGARLALDLHYQQRCYPPQFEIDWAPKLDPGPPYTLVVAVPTSVQADTDRLLQVLKQRLRVVGTRRSETPSHATVVATALDRTAHHRLTELAEEGHALLLLHPPAEHVEHLESQYRWSRSSLAGIRRLSGNIGPVLLPRQMAVVAALQSAPLAERAAFVNATLARVLAMKADAAYKLLDVIGGHCARLDSCALAERLNLHPKSVANRVRRLQELTGLSLAEPMGRLRLMLGYQAWVLNRPSLPPVGSARWLQGSRLVVTGPEAARTLGMSVAEKGGAG